MSMFNRFAALVEAFSTANRYKDLFAMSDRELATRGYTREGLTRSYISSLGGQ